MLSNEIAKLEQENRVLKAAMEKLQETMEKNQIVKPRCCQYCKNFIQHYMKDMSSFGSRYTPIYAGHCTCGVPISKGGKRNPKPDDTCPYFDLGIHELKRI